MMEEPADISGISMEAVKPRRAKEPNPIWTYIALGGYFALAGLIGGFLGALLANLI